MVQVKEAATADAVLDERICALAEKPVKFFKDPDSLIVKSITKVDPWSITRSGFAALFLISP